MKKSFLALMLAVALVSLSACGNQEKAPEATATPVVTEAPTEEPTAEPTEEPTAEPTEEPTAEPTKEPARPSQLFFGEIFGAIGCLPQFTPAMKPNVSLQMASSRIMRIPRSPWSVWK